jgi:hypothetical protein
MRRIISIIMSLTAVLTMISGIGEAISQHAGTSSPHVAVSVLFFLTACIHGWFNRRILLKYFSGPVWKWGIIIVVIIVVLAITSQIF